MPKAKPNDAPSLLPAGFTPQTGGLASEYAREQGWGTKKDERTRVRKEKQNSDGGTDYDYGAADFGDTANDTSQAKPPRGIRKPVQRQQKKTA